MLKRILTVAFAAVFLFCPIISGCTAHNTTEEQALLRIHVRADSNDEADQAVKMKVKSAVVSLLDPALADVKSLSEAMRVVSDALPDIERAANAVLEQNGFSYRAKARLTEEYFPTRAYEDVVVESGVYDALIIELGSAKGDNWWCVIYPPLCFVQPTYGSDFTYRSKIVEIWRRFTE